MGKRLEFVFGYYYVTFLLGKHITITERISLHLTATFLKFYTTNAMLGKRRRINSAVKRPFKRPRIIGRYTGPTTGNSTGAALLPSRTRGYTRRPSNLARQELKFYDLAQSFTFDATGEIAGGASGQIVAGIGQGNGDSTRDGKSIIVKSIQIRGELTFAPAGAANAATICYLFLVHDSQANGAAAGATDVFTGTNFATAMRNLNNGKRFKILQRWTWTFKATAGVTTAYNNDVGSLEYYKACNLPFTYGGTAGTVADMKEQNLFLMAGTDGNSDDLVTFTGNIRLRFIG